MGGDREPERRRVGDGGTSVLSREVRLLLATASLSAETDRISGLLSLDPDWSVLHALAVRERAVLPLWRRLSPFSSRLPQEVAEALRRLARVQEFRQAQLRKRLLESLAVLEREGIEVVLLKGAALAHTLYPDFAERPMLDLDVLVGPDRAGDACDALLAAGWCRDDSFEEDAYSDHFHLPPLRDGRGTGAVLEIHTGLFVAGHPFSLDGGRARSRAVAVRVAGKRALVLPPALQLLHVGLHFGWSHMLSSGAWRTFRDVEVVSGAAGFTWSEFRDLALESGGASSCYWTLRLANRLAGIEVPTEIIDRLRPPAPDGVLDRLERHYALTLFPSEPGCPSARLRRALWQLGTLPRPGSRGPRSAGHAAAPWSRSHDFVAAAEASPVSAESWLAKILRHARAVGSWGAYLLRVLRPSSPASREAGGVSRNPVRNPVASP